MPTNRAVPAWIACEIDSPKLAASEGAAKPIASTCIASAAQTSPKIASSRYWNGPVPAASSAWSIVLGRMGRRSSLARAA